MAAILTNLARADALPVQAKFRLKVLELAPALIGIGATLHVYEFSGFLSEMWRSGHGGRPGRRVPQVPV